MAQETKHNHLAIVPPTKQKERSFIGSAPDAASPDLTKTSFTASKQLKSVDSTEAITNKILRTTLKAEATNLVKNVGAKKLSLVEVKASGLKKELSTTDAHKVHNALKRVEASAKKVKSLGQKKDVSEHHKKEVHDKHVALESAAIRKLTRALERQGRQRIALQIVRLQSINAKVGTRTEPIGRNGKPSATTAPSTVKDSSQGGNFVTNNDGVVAQHHSRSTETRSDEKAPPTTLEKRGTILVFPGQSGTQGKADVAVTTEAKVATEINLDEEGFGKANRMLADAAIKADPRMAAQILGAGVGGVLRALSHKVDGDYNDFKTVRAA